MYEAEYSILSIPLWHIFDIIKITVNITFAGGAVFGSNVVNVESWRSVATLRGHEGDILDVAWSPGDVWLASASIDNNVIIWNTAKWPGGHAVLGTYCPSLLTFTVEAMITCFSHSTLYHSNSS